MAPHLLITKDIILTKKPYTMFWLADYAKLPSIYSQKIYVLLQSLNQYDDNDIITDTVGNNHIESKITPAYFHQMMYTPPSMFISFGSFRRLVLDQAEKDINNLTSLEYKHQALSWSNNPVKRGQKTRWIQFIINQPDKIYDYDRFVELDRFVLPYAISQYRKEFFQRKLKLVKG